VFDTSRKTIIRARQERRSGNLPEVLLWRELRQRPGGFKFRRQHPIERYILDFVCLEARLAIEIDGESHDRGDRPARDEIRDARLADLGFRTLRIPARDVLRDLDSVIRAIVSACCAGRPLHQPSAGPPPRSGAVFLGDLS
jgi:very-short-patch-repair endonuclease